MNRPIRLKFNSEIISRINVTKNLPQYGNHHLSFGTAELIRCTEGAIICQYHSHYLFFLEMIEFHLDKDFKAAYIAEEPSLFLFLVMRGSISFSTPDGRPIASAKKGVCYATYNKFGEYSYHLAAGVHRFFYITTRVTWLNKDDGDLPVLREFMNRIEQSDARYGHMPACLRNRTFSNYFKSLIDFRQNKDADIEAELFGKVKKVLLGYQRMVAIKLVQPVYRIRDYLDKHYFDTALSNETLAQTVYVTPKTMIKGFRKEFGMTPHEYYTRLRVQRAKWLLDTKKIPVKEVYLQVGYNDERTFRYEYDKVFGHPPSDKN